MPRMTSYNFIGISDQKYISDRMMNRSKMLLEKSINCTNWQISPRLWDLCCVLLCMRSRVKQIQKRLITTLRLLKSPDTSSIGLWAIVLSVSFILTAIFVNQCIGQNGRNVFYIGFWRLVSRTGRAYHMNKWSNAMFYIWIHHHHHGNQTDLYGFGVIFGWYVCDVQEIDGLIIGT